MKTLQAVSCPVGKRGTIVIASELREFYGLIEGAQVIQEPRPDGVMLRPAVSLPVRLYSDEEKAQFILNAAANQQEYAAAISDVKALGLDPSKIPHSPPK